MPSDNPKNALRRPRYPASAKEPVGIAVRRAAGKTPLDIDAELENISRGGFQLRTAIALDLGEAVTLRLRLPETAVDWQATAAVRWQQAHGKTWVLGCECEEPVDWEVLGQLFLGEALATGESACPPTAPTGARR